LTERFYSGRRDGQVTVRDGIGAASKRPLPPHAVLFKHGEKGSTRIGDGSGSAEIALALLADALGNEARAMAMHETFSRRVVALFPERWTISRTRVISYLSLIEFERRTGTTSDPHTAATTSPVER
jgi:hypothetical protein